MLLEMCDKIFKRQWSTIDRNLWHSKVSNCHWTITSFSKCAFISLYLLFMKIPAFTPHKPKTLPPPSFYEFLSRFANVCRCKLHYRHDRDHYASFSPAEIWRKHVELLRLGDDWMKGCSIRSIDHVTLICGPPFKRTANIKTTETHTNNR